MATHVAVFTDRENSIDVLGKEAKKNSSRSVDLKSTSKCFGNTLIKSEPRSALGDVSNNCTLPTGNSNCELQKCMSSKKNSSASVKRLLGTLHPPPANMPLVTAAELIDEGFQDDIEIMPPNDDDYPDNCEDIWPESERPTREHLQWLTKFYFTFGGDSDTRDQSDSALSPFDEDIYSLDDDLPNIAEPRIEKISPLYECEEPEEPSFHADDDSFIFH